MKSKIFILIILIIVIGCNKQAEHELVVIKSPTNHYSAQPNLFAGPDALYMSWQQDFDSSHTLNFSKFKDDEWSQPKELISGKNWFINWADYPALAVTENGKLLSSYLPKSGIGTYSYDINLVLDESGTVTKLHDDTTQTEHGFVYAIPIDENNFLVSWLDGRNTAGGDHDHDTNTGAMTLRAALVGDKGEKEQEWLLDDRVCDCCQTGAALTNDGPIVVYRNRSDEEIRDIYYTKYKNGSWIEPKPVASDNWKINGCPVNGPRVKAKNNNVVVAYFTAADNQPSVKLVISTDSGETFAAPLTVDSTHTIGRVDLEIVGNNEIWVSWMDTSDNKTRLNAANYSLNGDLIRQIKISEINAARMTGFPQMENFKENLYFAWTMSGDTSSIALKRLEL